MHEGFKLLHRFFWALLGLLVGLISLVLVMCGILIGLALYGAKTGALERWVSQGIGAPVQFQLSGFSWTQASPELTLSQIRIENPKTHQTVLTLSHAAVQINFWQSLKTRTLVTQSLSLAHLSYQPNNSPGTLLIQSLTLKSLSPHIWAISGHLSIQAPKISIPFDLTGVLQGEITDPHTLSTNLTLRDQLGGVIGIQAGPDPQHPEARLWHIQVSALSAQNFQAALPQLSGELTSLTVNLLENSAQMTLQNLSGVISHLGVLPTQTRLGILTQTLMLHADAQGLTLVFPQQNLTLLPPQAIAQTQPQTQPLNFQFESQTMIENFSEIHLHASLGQNGLSSIWNAHMVLPQPLDQIDQSTWQATTLELTSDTLWNQPLLNLTQDLLAWHLLPHTISDWINGHQLQLSQIQIQTHYRGTLSQIAAPSGWQITGQFSGLGGLFLPEWPLVQNMTGSFRGNTPTPGWIITVNQGTSLGMHLNQLTLTLNPLKLLINAQGSLTDAQNYLAHTPLYPTLIPLFQTLTWQGGQVNARIAYQTPTGWSTDLAFQDISSAALTLLPLLHVHQLSGHLILQNQWVSPKSYFNGTFLQKPLHLTMTSNSNQLDITAQGDAPVSLLAQRFPNPLWDSLSGAVPFRLQFIQAHLSRVIAQLSLRALQSTLPGPLAKPFGEPLDLSASLSWQPKIPRWDIGLSLINPAHTHTQLSLQGFANPQLIALSIQSPSLQGQIHWHFGIPNRLTCQLQTLQLNAQDFKNNDPNTPKKLLNLTPWPSIQCQVQNFYWNHTLLGQLNLTLIHPETTPQTLEIQNLSLQSNSFSVSLQGQVRAVSHQLLSRYHLQINAENWAGLLIQIGLKNWLSGGEGSLSGPLSYLSINLMPHLRALNAQLHIDLKNGSLSSINPGMSKFLGLMNVSDIARRFDLNFSDVMEKGLAFNTLEGDVQMAQGRLSTNNMALAGPALNLHLQGNTSIVTHTLDFQVLVIPQVSGGLALAATLLGGPIAGAATWVADKVLSDTVLKDKGWVYQISGSWEKPEISSLKNIS